MGDVWQGTLALMVLKTLESMGAQHGLGIARRIEQTSGDQLAVNYGTLYPALLKLEQNGYIRSEWGASSNNRKAKFYSLTSKGAKKIADAVAEKGGPALLTRDHFKVKLPYYSKAKAGDFSVSKAKQEYKKLCSDLHSKDVDSMDMKAFQELLGRIEVLGELIIQESKG